MKLYIRLLSLTMLLVLVAFGCSGPNRGDQSKLSELKVQDLQVQDIPADGGDGLMLSWKPLSKDKRVQEYRIYRGVHPDTLFFLAGVQVNVKTGVTTEQMFYYDSGYSSFISLESPRKLKNERGAKGSNLYSGIPRDPELAARLSECFNLISQADDSQYYFHTHKASSADKADSTVYAGLKFNQQTILASLKTKNPQEEPVKYYYTVVPVNERNQYLGIAEAVFGTPEDNAPEASPGLYAAALQDTRTLQFEWQYPLNHDDLGAYEILWLPTNAVNDSLWNQTSPAEKDSLAARQGKTIAQGAVGGGVLPNNCVLKEADLLGSAEELNWETASQGNFAIRFQDGGGNMSPLSPLAEIRITDSSALPIIAKFKVEDKPIDKGDRMSVIWQDPVVSITKTSAANSQGTKLKINYQVNKTDTQKISNIYFEFFEPGKDEAFARINEFYQDNIINLNIPGRYSLRTDKLPTDSLKVKITIATRPYRINDRNGRISYERSSLVRDYELVQYLKPDPVMMSYMPTKDLLLNGVNVSEINHIVYRKGYLGSAFTQMKSSTSYENNLDVNVNYVDAVVKPVLGFNFVKDGRLYTYMNGERHSRKIEKGEKAQDLALLPSDIDFTLHKDESSQQMLNISLYQDENLNKLKELQKGLDESRTKMRNLETQLKRDADPSPSLVMEHYSAMNEAWANLTELNLYLGNEHYKNALDQKGDRALMSYVASVREPEQRKHTYKIISTNGKGLFAETPADTLADGEYRYYAPISNWFDWNKLLTLIAVIIFGTMVVVFVNLAKKGKDLYMRPIAGLQEIDNAIGRATEMGRPMLYCMGNGSLSDVATLASMGILSLVAKKAAEYDTKLIVPCYDYIVMPIAQEIVREAHYAVGRPDSFDKNNVFYLTSVQFAYVAGVNGIMIREKMATNFFMGYFAAEALLMTETGNAVGAVQIAGSDAITQIPFFITTCDYTLIGEELYAASAYLNREPMLLGTLKAQDYFKFLILLLVIVGALLATFQVTGLMELFPLK